MFFPFMNVYFRSIGLSGTQIGLIGMTASLTAALSSTWWGMVNDRLGKIRLIFTITCLGSAAAGLALGRMPTFATILPVAGVFSLFNAPNFSLLDSTTLKLLGENRDRYGIYRLWGTIGFVLASSSSGFVLERLGLKAIFYAYAIGLLIFWALTQFLSGKASSQRVQLTAGEELG